MGNCLKKLAGFFIVAGFLLMGNSAFAQCNDASGFIKTKGPIFLGDVLILGPDCQSAQSGGTNPSPPSHPLAHPSSSNLVGSGCISSEAHNLWWIDQNLCSTADIWQITSFDQSAGFVSFLTGSPTVTDKITYNFTFGTGTCIAGASPACDASYTILPTDTLQVVANGIVCAIFNNPNLFFKNGGTCTGGNPVFAAPGIPYGGYGTGAQIGLVVQITNGFAFDFNSNVAMKVTSAVTGAGTEIITIANTNCGVRCSYSLDNNPALQMVRQSGAAPQPGSTLAAIYSIGATSLCPTTVCANWGAISSWVANSTAGSMQSAWLFQTPNTAGTLANGFWIGQGLYSNSGGAPFTSAATKDMGGNTVNLNLDGCYYLGYTVGGSIGNRICQVSGAGQFIIDAAGGNIININSGSGVGINSGALNGGTMNSAIGLFISGTQVPVTGSGVSITGGATPFLSAKNYGAPAFLPLAFSALSFDLKPSNSATSGVSVSANLLQPDADAATALGASGNRWTNGFFSASVQSPLFRSSSGTVQLSGAGSTGININSAGNIGLNTASPASQFHVHVITDENSIWVDGNTAGNGANPSGVGIWSLMDDMVTFQPVAFKASLHRFVTTTGEALKIQTSGGISIGGLADPGSGAINTTDIYTNNTTALIRTKQTLGNAAGASAGTITNAPSAGNPTKWISIDDNGTTRKIPTWQ